MGFTEKFSAERHLSPQLTELISLARFLPEVTESDEWFSLTQWAAINKKRTLTEKEMLHFSQLVIAVYLLLGFDSPTYALRRHGGKTNIYPQSHDKLIAFCFALTVDRNQSTLHLDMPPVTPNTNLLPPAGITLLNSHSIH